MTRPGREGSPEGKPRATPLGVQASSTSRVEQRSRARAASRLASTGRTGVSGARQTRSTVSSNVATTLCQRPSQPGLGMMTRWSRSAPSSVAAANPSSGRPVTAHQCPRDDAPANSRSSRLVNPGRRPAIAGPGPGVPPGPRSVPGTDAGPSRTVPPLGRPPPGNSSASSGRTGRTRSTGNGPVTWRCRGPGTTMPAACRAPGADGVPARAYVAMAEVYEHTFDKQRADELPENRALVARPRR
jgi:hypothetical protein